MREIDSDALRFVLPSLGIGSPIASTRPAVFDDDVLQQILDVGPLIRRGLSNRPTQWGGIFQLLFDHANTSGAAQTSSIAIDPWLGPSSSTPAEVQNGWVPQPDADLWLLYASLRDRSGTDTIEWAQLEMGTTTTPIPRLARTNGASLTTDTIPVIASWDDVAPVNNIVPDVTGATLVKLGLRVGHPGIQDDIVSRLRMSGNGEYHMAVYCMFTPPGLGQDAIAF